MKKRTGCAIAILAVVLFVWYTLWAAMQYHGIVHLGRGYQYWYTDAGVYMCLMAGEDRVDRVAQRAERNHQYDWDMPKAGPDVDGYRVYRRIITGHVAKARKTNEYGDRVIQAEGGKPGYFIMDVRNDSIYDGLSRQEWLKRLRSFGIVSEPHLYRPSIYDEILGRNKPTR